VGLPSLRLNRGEWRSARGSVTAEAAIGMAALMFLAMVLLQSLVVATTYVRMLSVQAEALRIATASGPPELQIASAEEFIHQKLVGVTVSHSSDGETVTLLLERQVQVMGVRWRPQLESSMTGRLLDASGTP